jgi:holo-[acyl-carrier protein] synthase
MKIHQGVDIVSVSKFRSVLTRHPRFIEDVFTPAERERCLAARDPYTHFAGRFAAKEACLKALGRGFSGMGIDYVFQEIEIVSPASGRPEIVLSGWAEKMSRRKKIGQSSVSISHTSDYAVATAIFVSEGESATTEHRAS